VQFDRLRAGPPSFFFAILGFFFTFIFGVMKMGLSFWENGCTTLPFFEPCPYTWRGEIFHSSWNLEIPKSFFSNFIFLNLDYTWTFISTIGIFVS
jgi:hypothetical protein